LVTRELHTSSCLGALRLCLPTPMLIEGTDVFKKPKRDGVHSSLETRTARQ
jgi:hypothetical protein